MIISFAGGVFYATCTFEERFIPKNAGWKFNSLTKRWETLNVDLVLTLKNYVDLSALQALTVHQNLKRKAVEASLAKESFTDYWKPEGLNYMSFQTAAIDFIMKRHVTLLADYPGLGKTITALGTANNLPKRERILIIVRSGLKYMWLRQAKKWLRPELSVGISQSIVVKGKTQKSWSDTNVVIISSDSLSVYHDELRKEVWDFIINDEAHDFTNITTIRAKNLFGGGRGKNKVTPIQSKKFLHMTGTPILSKPIDLWIYCRQGDPTGLGKDYRNFVYRYCGGHETAFGLFKDGATNLEELQFKLRSTFMIRRSKKTVITDLPDKLRGVVELPQEGLRKVVKKELKAFASNLEALYYLNNDYDVPENIPEVPLDALTSFVQDAKNKATTFETIKSEDIDFEDYIKLHFEAMSQAREELGIAKIPMVVEYARDILSQGEKVVIMTSHKATAEEYLKHFPGAAFVTGKVSAKKREQEEQRFQNNDDCRVFIGNIAAAGVGLTLTAASHLIFAELEWTPAEMEQAEDRIHRIGQTVVANIHYMVVRGSMEWLIVEKLIQRIEVINKTLNM
jgi:SNF2 family DNA or RNA helicase